MDSKNTGHAEASKRQESHAFRQNTGKEGEVGLEDEERLFKPATPLNEH